MNLKADSVGRDVDLSKSISGKRKRADSKDDGSKWFRNQKERYQE